MRHLIPLALLAAFGVAVVSAAPVKSDKKEDFGPVTDEQVKESQNNLKQIMLAMHSYHDVTGHFPNNVVDDNKKPTLSWRVHLLPYLEQDQLYKQFDLTEGWDGPTNKKLIAKMPKVYAPVRVKTKDDGLTFYRGFTGDGTVFEAGLRLGLFGITDGTSNTVGVVEAGEACVWTKPDDLPIDPTRDLPKLGGLFDGEFNLALCDGSVRRVKAKFNATVLKAMITRAGGEVFDADGLDE